MTLTTIKNFVQYCHSIEYNGLTKSQAEIREKKKHNNRRNGNKMTLRIEQLDSNRYIVTVAVCSEGDAFVKKSGRKLTDFKANVLKNCMEGSAKSLNVDYVRALTLKDPEESHPNIDIVIESFTLNDKKRLSPLGQLIYFKNPIAKPKEAIEIIMRLYENGSYDFLEY